jgi:hypothetical protein
MSVRADADEAQIQIHVSGPKQKLLEMRLIRVERSEPLGEQNTVMLWLESWRCAWYDWLHLALQPRSRRKPRRMMLNLYTTLTTNYGQPYF